MSAGREERAAGVVRDRVGTARCVLYSESVERVSGYTVTELADTRSPHSLYGKHLHAYRDNPLAFGITETGT